MHNMLLENNIEDKKFDLIWLVHSAYDSIKSLARHLETPIFFDIPEIKQFALSGKPQELRIALINIFRNALITNTSGPIFTKIITHDDDLQTVSIEVSNSLLEVVGSLSI